MTASASSSQFIALLAAKFDFSGNRIWQVRINTALRGFFSTGESTSIVETNNGRVFVAFHPRVVPTAFLTRVCELASNNGALLSCADLPLQGRVAHLIPVENQLHVWVNTSFENGMALYQIDTDAPGNIVLQPRSMFVPKVFARTNAGLNFDDGNYYLTLSANDSQVSSAVRYIKVQFATPSNFVFTSGFE